MRAEARFLGPGGSRVVGPGVRFCKGPSWCHKRMQGLISGASPIRQQQGQVELGGAQRVGL